MLQCYTYIDLFIFLFELLFRKKHIFISKNIYLHFYNINNNTSKIYIEKWANQNLNMNTLSESDSEESDKYSSDSEDSSEEDIAVDWK